MEGKQQSRREALAKCAKDAFAAALSDTSKSSCWEGVADFIIAEQERREGPLVEVLETISRDCVFWPKGSADAALAAHRALDAPPPPQRTVEEINHDIQRLRTRSLESGPFRSLLDELDAALARESGKE